MVIVNEYEYTNTNILYTHTNMHGLCNNIVWKPTHLQALNLTLMVSSCSGGLVYKSAVINKGPIRKRFVIRLENRM